ncbi:unnamed protein product [Rotaria sp. Silwood1]|nr:unnamed protein product [Rotaria sp. Silwood1]
MNSSNCSPLLVQKMFQSLLSNPTTSNTSTTSHQNLPAPTTSRPLTSPPKKNSIRLIENDQNGRREKYDGYRWRLVCTWHLCECTNIAYSYQLCAKHNALRRNKELPKRKRKPLLTHSSLPIMNQHNHNNLHDDDDIEILEEYCKNSTNRCSVSSNIKAEASDYHMFSVDNLNESHLFDAIKSEPKVSSSYSLTKTNDVEYITSTTRSNGFNITELVSKNIPPLTEFEEECLASRLMERYPTTCLMLDAQLFLHDEALAMDAVAPEYFYDFLLRHPRVALHYSNWFLRCKPVPPTTGCSIDTKVWTLSMTVRGAMAVDHMNDECAE